jgi:hypothetical protein
MPRHCTVCGHEQRTAIDQKLVEGVALPELIAVYRVSKDALWRHKENHIPIRLVQAQDVAEVAEADSLLDRLRAINQETAAVLREAKRARNFDLVLRAIARCEKQIELGGRLLGELQDGQPVNIVVSPEWLQVRGLILEATAPYPAARTAIVEALGKVNGHERD